MIDNTEENCLNCRFFDHSNLPSGNGDLESDMVAICRRHPPVVQPFAWDRSEKSGNSAEQVQAHSLFPGTMLGDWCGEWKARHAD